MGRPKTTSLGLVLLAWAAVGAPHANDPGPLLWPVALEPGLSSGFCDYRDGRFHAGVDVRTFGREGVACLAAGDGWISRMRASSRGYGKALHLTLDAGVQLVYAHLAEFAPELEDTLWAEQLRAGRYAADVALPPSRFRVRRGDVIAYSGSTGATAPHLHFEVRTLDDEPLNPLSNGLALADRERPLVPRVAFVPLTGEATVEGRRYPLELEPRRVASGRYQIDDTLHFSGDVGVAATVVDKLNRRSGRLTPHELQVWSDGTRLARVSFERFGFAEAKHVDHALDMGALRARGTDIYTLYQRAGDARARAEFLRGGRIAPAPTTRRVHQGRVVALDAAGNRSEVAFHYTDSVTVATDPEKRRRPVAGARWRQSQLAVDLDGAYFHDDFALVPVRDPRHLLTQRRHTDEHEAHADTVVLRAADLFDKTMPLSEAHPSFSGSAPPTVPLLFSALRAGAAGVLSFPSLAVEIAYPADVVYADAVVYADDEGDAHSERQRSLRARSPAVRLGPAGLVLKRPAQLRFHLDAATARDGVFRSGDNGGTWSYVATTADSAGVSAALDRPGVFAVFRDETAPWIGEAELVAAVSYATAATTYEIHVPVDDEGSGFDDTRTEVTVGGQKRIWRWDLTGKKIVVALRGESIIGPQPVTVVAFDRIGNSARAEATVTVENRTSH